MPDLASRYDHERTIALALAALYGQQRERLLQLLGPNRDISRIPDSEWARIEKETNDALRGELLLIYLLAAQNMRISPRILPNQAIAQGGLDFANARAQRIAGQMTANTRAGLHDVVQAAHAEARLPQNPFATVQDVLDKESKFRTTLTNLLGPSRAEAVAITETTSAITAAERGSIEEAARATGTDHREVLKVVIWHTQEDAKVCPHCKPLDGRRMDEWTNFVSGSILAAIEANGGPPAHIRCRCYTTVELPEDWWH